MEKYRVHEVAKDFGLPTKTITEILTKYASAPKNHMQVLTDHELSVIFDYLTQHNQVSGIQVIFSDTFKEEKKAEAPKAAAPAPEKSGPQNGEKPAAAKAPRARALRTRPRSSRWCSSPSAAFPRRRSWTPARAAM